MKKSTRTLTRLLCALLLAALLLPTLASTAMTKASTATDQLASAVADLLDEELPSIYLTTDDGNIVETKTYKSGKLSMTVPKSMTGYDNDYADNPGKIEIRCRGNSTFETTPDRLGEGKKYSYKIKLDKKADMLGMGKSKHWVLIANFYDVTNMRNKLTYDLSARMGLTYTQSRWVEVYLNGEYRGIYTLCESVKIAKDRVNIPDWEDRAEDVAKAIANAEGLDKKAADALEEGMVANLAWITSGKYKNYKIADYYDTSNWNINTGYLIEYDNRMDGDTTKFYTSHGKPMQLDSPEALDTNPQMLSYVKGLLNDFEEAIYSPTFCTSDGRHYSEFVDVASLVDYFLIFNLFKNIEFGALSIYLYIMDGKIYFGPCWDFDGGCGNQVTLQEGWYSPESWFYMGRAEWWNELCGDPAYVAYAADRWFEIRPYVEEMMDMMPAYHDYIKEASDRDSKKFGMPVNWYMKHKRCTDFESEYQTLYNWMKTRISWLDKQFALRDPNIEGCGAECSDRLYTTLKYSGGSTLDADRLTVGEYPADYMISTKNTKSLTLDVKTAHISHRFLELYVNGKKIGERVTFTEDTPAHFEIPVSALDLTEGAVNTIYIIGINWDNNYYRTTYLTVRARSGKNPTSDQVVVRVQGQAPQTVKRGSSITLPSATAKEDGYTQIGWSNGSGKYKAGTSYMVLSNVYLSYSWQRNELFPDHTERKITPEPTVPDVTTTTTATTTTSPITTIKPTTSTQPTTSELITTTTTPTTTPIVTTEGQTTTEPDATTTTPSTTTKPNTTTEPITTKPSTTAPITTDNGGENNTDKTEGSSATIIIIIGTAAALIIAAAAVLIVVLGKKKK